MKFHRSSKRPRVEIGHRTFVAGDSYLVVLEHGRVADLRGWQRPATKHRPRNVSDLQVAASEWLSQEHPEESQRPQEDFWSI